MNTPKKILFSLFLSIILLVCSEGALQLYEIPSKGIYQGDPATLWTLRPNLNQQISNPPYPFSVRTDKHGFRGEATSGAWLALGCSTTFGWGVEEEEAWPAILSREIGIPIINGGVPGWSTHQAKQKVAEWNHFQPPVVLVAYIVRDSQSAIRSDSAAQPSPFWSRLQLFRLMDQLISPPKSDTSNGYTHRVPLEEYKINLQEIQDSFPNSEVLFFPFPQKNPSNPWIDVLHSLPHIEVPSASEHWFFREDEIHLNPAGHKNLASFLKSSLVDASILPPSH
ncbi:MAG: hypothetical protein CL916_10140 [Deltaproteobacteria bacterium]|nr:hypothetical protein [Deltaproteobacteria bacterium]